MTPLNSPSISPLYGTKNKGSAFASMVKNNEGEGSPMFTIPRGLGRSSGKK
ncbi:MAG: hypothetical protein MJ252_11245 [archaeon]|nr:hypothetical protein [archaeon]